jgi:hypothetical protein
VPFIFIKKKYSHRKLNNNPLKKFAFNGKNASKLFSFSDHLPFGASGVTPNHQDRIFFFFLKS